MRIVTAREQMAVAIHGHDDRRVTEALLHHLGRQFQAAIRSAVDAPRREEMAHRVQSGVSRAHDRLALRIERDLAMSVLHNVRDAGRDLDRPQAALDDVTVVLDVPCAVRKHEVKLSIRTFELPFAQDVEHRRRNRDCALAGLALRLADVIEAIGALSDVKLAFLEIDVRPAQAAKLAGAQAAEGGHKEQWSPVALRGRQYRLDLRRRRNVDPDLELPALSTLCLALLAATAAGPEIADDVVRDQATFLRVGEDPAEAAAYLAHHGGRD